MALSRGTDTPPRNRNRGPFQVRKTPLNCDQKVTLKWKTNKRYASWGPIFLGNVSETPTPTTCLKSTAVHLQFVRQYAPHSYRRAFLASKLRRKGNPCNTPPICTAVRLPFVRQYAPHLYGSTFGKILGLGSPERF